MAQNINYKNLLNGFVDYTKAYAQDVNNRLRNLFLYYNMGCVEEFMYTRNFKTGTLGTGPITLLGIPEGMFERLSGYRQTLKSKIENETTLIQTNLNSCSPRDSEVVYIKNTLNKHLENQFDDIISEITSIVTNIRTHQKNLSDEIDKLNFITNHSYDGTYLNRGGGKVVAFQLTATTALTSLSTEFIGSGVYLNDYINNYFITNFYKNYPNSEEYLLFSNKIYTNDLLSFKLGGNYFKQLKELITYKSDGLYNDLLNKDKNGVKGLTYKTLLRFQPKLNEIIKVWVKYDLNLMEEKIIRGIDKGLEVFNDNINNYYSDFKVGYSINTGTTSQDLVRVNLRDRGNGVVDNRVNFKQLGQLYIS